MPVPLAFIALGAAGALIIDKVLTKSEKKVNAVIPTPIPEKVEPEPKPKPKPKPKKKEETEENED